MRSNLADKELRPQRNEGIGHASKIQDLLTVLHLHTHTKHIFVGFFPSISLSCNVTSIDIIAMAAIF